ncbi:hypothetical protein [Streptomyces sp. WMMB 322]|uniref:hypothetical protein n=1 Tax=Streptomyces sp. WMMB 322 TaxID=1286821 RepID=UPI000823CF80|nr:hypothetical protein [Streptomyces sp. WMMB 322]SCK56394.1 hypothetical protein H180DRAFT_05238 [Streptomyces sp. WMMB 322]
MLPLAGVASVLTPLVIVMPLTVAASFLLPRRYGVRSEVSRQSLAANGGVCAVLLLGTLVLGGTGHVGGNEVWPLHFGTAGAALVFVCTVIVVRDNARRDARRAAEAGELLREAGRVANELYPYLADGPEGERAGRRAQEQLGASGRDASRGAGTGAMRALHGAMAGLRDELDPSRGVPPEGELRALHGLIEQSRPDTRAGFLAGRSPAGTA